MDISTIELNDLIAFNPLMLMESSMFLSKKQHVLATKRLRTNIVSFGEQPKAATVIHSVLDELREHGHHNPIVFGVIPFCKKNKAYFNYYGDYKRIVIPQKININEDVQLLETHLVNNKETFTEAVNLGLNAFNKGALKKIVLSQALDIQLSQACTPILLALKLYQQNASAYTFSIPVKEEGFMVGASPELLLAKYGDYVESNPLAGSRALIQDPYIREQRRQELISSKKERYEHDMVAKHVYQVLLPFVNHLSYPSPELIETSTMMHLSSLFQAKIKDASTSLLDIALALHPTPAVCGTPTDLAKEFILQHEGYDREFYAGMVGWMDADGNGEWVVTIRCGFLKGDKIRLYAGAGIVPGSEASAEWAETNSKMQTMLNLFL